MYQVHFDEDGSKRYGSAHSKPSSKVAVEALILSGKIVVDSVLQTGPSKLNLETQGCSVASSSSLAPRLARPFP